MSETLDLIHTTIQKEIKSLTKINCSIPPEYETVVSTLKKINGKVIFMGIGKSGHIGKKLASTFSSTGTPAFFIHASESMHGDLGMIEKNDVVILISNSGETSEILAPLDSIKLIGTTTIAMTGNSNSTLAKKCDFLIPVHVEYEADSLNLAPTSSSTACLVVGDALACTLSSLKGFTKKDFAVFHPGGSLGKKLLSDKNI
ncbi:SIS domain-containing protein [Ligilactobacillus sp. WILCCON 0076]|uniref:SIS domain-containing protein n=1 Tax=Ligilactobacillus ubinensis TaxID=2876789 RepID=A0A9X2FT05_9LACO|nr:SIS domain-containing protein [Ligilactobacillus ubinensis]MCP0888018.1 SIS domain-containing protein [Ligilactobacillus ubinensis]